MSSFDRISETSITPPNSVVLVIGSEQADPPETVETGPTSATPTCVAIGTRSSADGETHLSIRKGPAGDMEEGWSRRVHPIQRVRGAVRVMDVEWNELMALPWSGPDCVVTVDVDDDNEPATIRLSITAVDPSG